MRLNQSQKEIVREETRRLFGSGARVRLFGSRVDDSGRGGDIDLHIEADGTPEELLDRELRLHAHLLRRLGDRHIDIVVHRRSAPLRPIDEHALRTGIPL